MSGDSVLKSHLASWTAEAKLKRVGKPSPSPLKRCELLRPAAIHFCEVSDVCSPTMISLESVLPPLSISPNNLKRLPGRLETKKDACSSLKHAYATEIMPRASTINVPQSECNQEQVCFIHNKNHITTTCKSKSMLKREVVCAPLVTLDKSFSPLLELFFKKLGRDICSFCYLTAAKQTIRTCKYS